jgi:metal-dependent amidase/aminoacylase/carboxypeptidase family protein
MKKFSYLAIASCLCFGAQAKPETSAQQHMSSEIEPEVIAWRHHFHEFPELSNREFNDDEAPVHHTPEFYVDDSGVKLGVDLLTNMTVDYLFAE